MTEFKVFVDPDNGAGTDYTSLNSGETALDCDLTASATKVFAGSKTGTVGDGASVTLYRGGASQGVTATVLHVATGGQILLQSISTPGFDFQVNDQWRVDASNYFQISSTGDSASVIFSCRSSSGTADTVTVDFDGWTTSATNRVKILSEGANKHSGVWDSAKYRMYHTATAANQKAIIINAQNIDIQFLQIRITGGYGNHVAIALNGPYNGGGGHIKGNIIRANPLTASYASQFGIQNSGYVGKSFIYNNIIYDFTDDVNGSGIGILVTNIVDPNYHVIYNNTVYNCWRGIRTAGQLLKDNLVQQFYSDSYAGSYDSNSGRNMSDDTVLTHIWGAVHKSGTTTSTDSYKLKDSGGGLAGVKVGMCVKNTTDGTYTYVTQVNGDTELTLFNDIFTSGEGYQVWENMKGSVTFKDAGARNLHLSAFDVQAHNKGWNLYSDATLPVTDDIDGEARPSSGTFDLGADEAPMFEGAYNAVQERGQQYGQCQGQNL